MLSGLPVRSRSQSEGGDAMTVQDWLRQMRLLRAEAQDLRTVLADVRSGGVPLPRYVDYIRKAYGDMGILGFADVDAAALMANDEKVADELEAALAAASRRTG